MLGVTFDTRHETVNVISRTLDDLEKREIVIEQDASDAAALIV